MSDDDERRVTLRFTQAHFDLLVRAVDGFVIAERLEGDVLARKLVAKLRRASWRNQRRAAEVQP